MNVEKTAQGLVTWLQEKVREAHAKGVILGLSGGIDSAVAAVIAKQAFPDETLGVMMPCGNVDEDLLHAQLLADTFQIKSCTVDLQPVYDQLVQLLEGYTEKNSSELAARSNIKPRLRMTTLYYLAQAKNYLVLGTSNKSERTVGYFTKHGDGGSDLQLLGDLTKQEVYKLAEYLNIPEVICQKAPSAGLFEGQTDEQDMGFTYQQLDEYIMTGTTSNPAALEKIQRMERNSQHKRVLPPIAPVIRKN